MIYHVYADGSCFPNPGPASYGVVVLDDSTDEQVDSFGAYIGKASNNVAEYSGVKAALIWCKEHTSKQDTVYVYSDSQLVVNQVLENWQVSTKGLKKIHKETKRIYKDLPWVTLCWVSRDYTGLAHDIADTYRKKS